MRLRKRPEFVQDEKVAHRMASMQTVDFPLWIEQCLVQIGRSMLEYQRTGEDYHLDEMVMSANTCHALVEEYKRRNT